MGKIMSKAEAARVNALNAIASEVAALICESGSLSEMLGDRVRAAKPHITTQEHIDDFAACIKAECQACGLTEGSFKVYLSNIRGVLKAMIQGYEPAEGAGLRAMYDGRPDSGTSKRTARQPGKGKTTKGAEVKLTPATPAELIRALFGFHTAELEDAVAYAKEHSGMFMSWASASAKASQVVQPLKKAA